ncbi:MAG: hypothetical protein RM022_022215 [Nostoc sp. EfeVER01]|nr:MULTISPECIES: hypothetical protein [unclassified Nostoc]MDZ7945181.1 hypothetical protein [Nostoc sp. EfeVER01]MDZ7991532.1 hypothetical protein [Nostoc sp. EspVER01]
MRSANFFLVFPRSQSPTGKEIEERIIAIAAYSTSGSYEVHPQS